MPSWRGFLARFIVRRQTWYVLCWLAAVIVSGIEIYQARHAYDSKKNEDPLSRRRDGNAGHTLVDFGAQWLTAHLVATGRGRELFLPDPQRQSLEANYPQADEPPAAKAHDADELFGNMMDLPADGGRPRLHGPLYPPTHALLFAPLGRLPPREAYRDAQWLFLAMGWLAGLAISGISRGRFWWPAATMLVMIFPGFGPALHLAQNSALSLAIVVVGWWLVSRGWEGSGGLVWGLLAYKPVWAAAFLLVPLLTSRWRMLAAMVVTGLAFVLATLPFVGVQTWLDWLRIGRVAADLYKVDDNWVFLSRDLLGIPRRWLLNFDEPREVRDRAVAAVAGWTLWAGVVAVTVVVAVRRPRGVRQHDGYGAAFVALGAWASSYHFIYYDSLLAMFPIALLLSDPRRFLRPLLLAAAPPPPKLAPFYAPRPVSELPPDSAVPVGPWTAAVLNSFVLTAVALLVFIEQTLPNLDFQGSLSVGLLTNTAAMPSAIRELVANPLRFSTAQAGTPWDTFVLLALWAYCGARVLMSEAKPQAA
jgi:hypothetical protein